MKSQRLSQSSPGGDGACASTRSGERGAYALFVKYGLFMRLGTNRMSAVAELSATPPMGTFHALNVSADRIAKSGGTPLSRKGWRSARDHSSVMQFGVTLLTRKTFRRALTRVNRANRYRVYAFGNVYDFSADLRIILFRILTCHGHELFKTRKEFAKTRIPG
jgi:hypothetical protein